MSIALVGVVSPRQPRGIDMLLILQYTAGSQFYRGGALMIQRWLFVGLFLAWLSVPAGAQGQETGFSMGSSERAALKLTLQDTVERLTSSPKAPYFGTTGGCDGNYSGAPGNLTSGNISPATFPSTTATMGTAVKMAAKDKIQIQSTIQCSTDASTQIGSVIAILDKNGTLFLADPDTAAVFPFICSVSTPFRFHTGVWWFKAADYAGSFAPGVTSIFRLDTKGAGSGTIAFRSLCVDKVK